MSNPSQRILLLMPFLKQGGVERVTMNLGEEMIRRSMIVDFAVMNRAEDSYRDQIPAGVNFIEFKQPNFLYAAIKLAGYLRENKPVAIISALTPANLAALLARKLSFAKTKIYCGVHITIGSSSSASRLKAILRSFAYRFVLIWADAIIAPSLDIKNELLKIGISSSKIKIIYNPVVTRSLYEKSEMKTNNDYRFDNRSLPIVLGIGRLHEQKNFPVLIEAFNIARHKIGANLLIIGEGEERKKLERLVNSLELRGKVDMPGFVKNPYPIIKRAAVMVLPSSWEGPSLVLCEALALGTQIVSTASVGGPVEILENGRYGRLVPVNDEKRMAEMIIEAIKNPINDSELKKRARDFSATIAVDSYINLIQNGR